MNEEDLKRCDRLIREQNVGIPSDQILVSEVPALVAEVRRLNLQNDEARKIIQAFVDCAPGENWAEELCAVLPKAEAFLQGNTEKQPDEPQKVKQSILFLIDFLKRRGIAKGADKDYDGGSYADELRGLADALEIELP